MFRRPLVPSVRPCGRGPRPGCRRSEITDGTHEAQFGNNELHSPTPQPAAFARIPELEPRASTSSRSLKSGSELGEFSDFKASGTMRSPLACTTQRTTPRPVLSKPMQVPRCRSRVGRPSQAAVAGDPSSPTSALGLYTAMYATSGPLRRHPRKLPVHTRFPDVSEALEAAARSAGHPHVPDELAPGSRTSAETTSRPCREGRPPRPEPGNAKPERPRARSMDGSGSEVRLGGRTRT